MLRSSVQLCHEKFLPSRSRFSLVCAFQAEFAKQVVAAANGKPLVLVLVNGGALGIEDLTVLDGKPLLMDLGLLDSAGYVVETGLSRSAGCVMERGFT